MRVGSKGVRVCVECQGVRVETVLAGRARVGGGAVRDEGSYLRLIDCCNTQLKVQGPSSTCNESNEEEEEACWGSGCRVQGSGVRVHGAGCRVCTMYQNDDFAGRHVPLYGTYKTVKPRFRPWLPDSSP